MTVSVDVFLNRADDLFRRFDFDRSGVYQEGDELEHVITLDVDIEDVDGDLGNAVLNRSYAMLNRGSGVFVGNDVYAHRSLSVGDVLEVLGSRFTVAGIGFVRLGDAT